MKLKLELKLEIHIENRFMRQTNITNSLSNFYRVLNSDVIVRCYCRPFFFLFVYIHTLSTIVVPIN